MRFHFRSPALLLSTFIIVALSATAATLLLAVSRPAVDAPLLTRPGALPLLYSQGAERLVVGLVSTEFDAPRAGLDRARIEERLTSDPDLGILFEAADFVEDPDMLPDYATSDRFYERQRRIERLLSGSEVLVARSAASGFAGSIELERVPVVSIRSPAALPASFWIQIVSGMVVLFIAAIFLALRPRSAAVISFALAGLGITGAAYSAAIYSSRQLGMGSELMLALSVVNHVFTTSFGIGMIGLFSVYPVRIAPPVLTALPAAVVSYGCLVAYRLRILPHDVVMLQNVVALLLLAILLAVFLQYRATRGRPADRAALVWLGLSVVLGATTFVLLVIMPVTLGLPGVVTQAFGFILLAMIYVGIAFAVARYRLFDIGRWSYRVLIYSGMILALLALDVAFVLGLQLSERASLAAASVIMLLLYFPLRDMVQERLLRGSQRNLPELYRQAVAAAYRFTPAGRRDAWRRLMEDAFRPGHVGEPEGGPGEVAVRNEGIEIALPAYPWSGPLTLGFAEQGRRLFGTRDVRLVEELAEIAAAAHADRLSYEKGAQEERQRIARDLHDDVGSTLLSGLHAADEGRRQETLVEALSDIRRIAHDLAGRELAMERFIAQLRHDMRQRVSAMGRLLEWPLGGADEDHTVLPYRYHHHLSAIVREAVTNALKHGRGAIRISAEIEDGMLMMGISNAADTASAGEEAGREAGIGLRNIARRAAELGGGAEGRRVGNSFLVSLDVPLPREPA